MVSIISHLKRKGEHDSSDMGVIERGISQSITLHPFEINNYIDPIIA